MRVGELIQLTDSNNDIIDNVCYDSLALWPDQSTKWLRLRFIDSLKANEDKRYKIEKKPNISSHTLAPCVNCSQSILTVNTQAETFVFDLTRFLAFSSASFQSTAIEILTVNEQAYQIKNLQVNHACKHNGEAYLYVDIQQSADCVIDNECVLELKSEIGISVLTGDIEIRCTITNPKSAVHSQGKWDLGDPHSIDLKAINWTAVINETTEVFELEIDKKHKFKDFQEFTLHQASSGQDNWRSAIHVNKDNQVDLPFQGYDVSINGNATKRGNQASPILRFGPEQDSKYLKVQHFWQNFPSMMEKKANTLSLSLLGAIQSPVTELQAGEQKTRQWSLTTEEPLKDKLSVTLDADYVASTFAIFSHLQSDKPSPFSDLINQGLIGDNSFDAKRHLSDSYGWRHFGELHADHEKSLSKQVEDFVSHYNNQYDPIYGMLIQWLKTGNPRWFELADELAKHVSDIDVYHTERDKPDYNGGLFWHTDHYVQAYTATHRSYSKHQPSDVYDDHAGSGGPGGQHCYTQGLSLHYLLTSYTPSIDAVLKLTRWIETVYEGDGTLISLALAVKNRHRIDLKNVFTGQYPLDRGTGNYVHALLDTYELTGKLSSLIKAEKVISLTISSRDNIIERELENIEKTWFYTVFLQATCRFLHLASKLSDSTISQITQIKDSLIHYVKWMIEHEYLYLDKPEVLEFPNQTWTAQDLRKVCVLGFALPFLSAKEYAQASDKMHTFLTTISDRLNQHEETSNTRVLCLMMQNGHIDDYIQAGQQVHAFITTQTTTNVDKLQSSGLAKDFIAKLQSFSLSRERNSALRRFPQLAKWLGEQK